MRHSETVEAMQGASNAVQQQKGRWSCDRALDCDLGKYKATDTNSRALRVLVRLNGSLSALTPPHTVWHSWKSGLSQSESAQSYLRSILINGVV